MISLLLIFINVLEAKFQFPCEKVKATYFYNYFRNNSSNMKQLWSGIKSVISIRKSSNVNVINKLGDPDGNITSDPKVIANIFNKFFVNISHDITKTVPRSNKSRITFMSDRVGNSFFIAPSVPSDISDIISLNIWKVSWS